LENKKISHSILVSIVIPVYNRFEVAARAIKSVIDQTYTHWELFVIDDNSHQPYTLPDFVTPYLHKITLVRNTINQGPGLSRQKGADMANGTYICFLDSDDYYHPEFLELSVQTHVNTPYIIGTYTTAINVPSNLVRKQSNLSFENILPYLFTHNRPWATCSWLWKANNLPKWKPIRTNQDSLFEIETAIINNSIYHINRPLCYIDKDTGQNTIDLVGNPLGEKNRNEVAIFALNNLHHFSSLSNYNAIKKATISRVIYTCSKLIVIGDRSSIHKSAKALFIYTPIKSIIVLLCSLIIGNSKYIKKVSNLLLKLSSI
jgi:glycosyltransferase involved in cell wall biosynthesis